MNRQISPCRGHLPMARGPRGSETHALTNRVDDRPSSTVQLLEIRRGNERHSARGRLRTI
eukprot:7721827-Lingulodinium_polyedra.AAC.1